MDIHKPKPWHGIREFLKEYAIIVIGVLTALGAEQAVEWLHWRHEIAEAQNVLGREITYNIKALKRMDQQNSCLLERMDALAAWASGTGPRPVGAVRMPLNYVLQTHAWEVANTGQVTSHFPLETKILYADLFTRFDNLRDSINDERRAWAQIVALANQQKPDAEELRGLREAIGLARVWEALRRNNVDLVSGPGSRMAVDGPGPPPLPPSGNLYFAPCAPISPDTR